MSADPRRDQIADATKRHAWNPAYDACRCGVDVDRDYPDTGMNGHRADVVLPILHAAVEQARAETAEQIAQALDDINSAYAGDPGVQRGLRIAALVVRKREESRP